MINTSFKNTYLELGDAFYQQCKPMPVKKPGLIILNQDLAKQLGIDTKVDESLLADIFSGNRLHVSCQPLAMAYAGHQFGHFNPQLGDGRAIYLGELELQTGGSLDIQLKGSGQTRYSRNGDGRAALGPVLREYLLSEAMHQLNVPTTRALAAVTSGEEVAREQLLPGGVITRAARSFIRVGSFQYIAMLDDARALQALADYVIERNYPELLEAEQEQVYLSLFAKIVQGQAQLIARWMQLGFIHGVMNTDNMSVAGETIDYGPCAFMDYYQHAQVYSSIDRDGRYAYSNQPSIGLWNLTRLAEAMLPLFADDTERAVELAKTELQNFIVSYEQAWLSGMREKCGISASAAVSADEDKALLQSLLNLMDQQQADFTQTFYYLSRCNAEPDEESDEKLRQLFKQPQALDDWLQQWRQRLSLESSSDTERQAAMQQVNPLYIPRNHQIEAVIRAAEDHNDFAPFYALHDVLQKPFQYQPGKDKYTLPPEPDEVVQKTFCGT